MADHVRHAIGPSGVCACGSTHSWERAKHGTCSCSAPRCLRVHVALTGRTRRD